MSDYKQRAESAEHNFRIEHDKVKELEAALKKIKKYCNERKILGIGEKRYTTPNESLNLILSWIEGWAQKALEK